MSSSVRPHQRAFALVLALVFLATTVATGIAVFWSIQQESNDTSSTTPQEITMLKGTTLANFTPVDSVDELQKIDLVPGSGETVEPGASVTVHYTGALAKDGTIFESSKDSGQPASFPLSGVIAGWTEGVPGMKVGGTRRLVIPSDKAYGAQGSGASIPPNADLVFDIELISIDN